MTDNIKNDAIDFLFKVAVVREESLTSTFEKTPQQLLHPEVERIPVASETSASAPAPTPAHRKSSSPERVQTIRRDQPKVGRNDPCPCGSGKKYKKCHGA